MNESIYKFFLKILKLQAPIFWLFVISVFISILYQTAGQDFDWSMSTTQFLAYVKTIYLPIALFVLIFQFLILKGGQLQLFCFYNIWIKHVFKILKRLTSSSPKEYIRKFSDWLLDRFFNVYFDSLILDSWSPPTYNGGFPTLIPRLSFKNKPVFIRREHLMTKNFWPNWAFSIVILFNDLTIYKNMNNINKIRLEVDLRYQLYGIYNNAGKEFLRDKFLEGEAFENYIEETDEIEEFLKREGPGKKEIHAKATPLRWASGGVLPIAYWRGEYWYVLFFRGINPVGWNMPNGASETKEEYIDINRLKMRELSEELILLDREPQIDDPGIIGQKRFRLSDLFDELSNEVKDEIMSEKFIEKHGNLRKNHDSLTINSIEGPTLEQIRTPFEIKITFHSKNLENRTKNIENTLFCLNPLEFGIESTFLYAFKMNRNDYIFFGEIWEVAECLLREPALLLSCDYVKEVFEKNGSKLGERVMEKPHLDCKILDKIPFGRYHIFDKDIEFRRRRKDQIIKEEVRFLFSIDLSSQSGLDSDKSISNDLRMAFKNNKIELSEESTISIEKKASIWLIKNKATINKQMFVVRKEEEVLNVYKFRTYEIQLEFDLHKGWLDDYGNLFKDLQKETYLFSWGNIPGNDSGRLLMFLRVDLDIGWTENAEIYKSNDGCTIRIFKNENSVEIMIEENKEKTTLKISDGRTHYLKVKKENGKLNIYKGCDINKNEHRPACMLCPVTWKTIELVYKYDLFREVFKDG